MKIPEGYMLVPIGWQPIMGEIERRASKMEGDSEFTVTIFADDLKAIEATPPVPEPKYSVKSFSVGSRAGHGERFHHIQAEITGMGPYWFYDERECDAAVKYLNEQLGVKK